MTESPCSAFEALPRSPSFFMRPLSRLSVRLLHLYGFTVCFLRDRRVVSHCHLLFYLPLFPPSPDSLILSLSLSLFLSASCYCNHLFTQPVAHFLPSPVSYSLILSDFVMLMQEKPYLFNLQNAATNSDCVSLFVSELLTCVVH